MWEPHSLHWTNERPADDETHCPLPVLQKIVSLILIKIIAEVTVWQNFIEEMESL